MLDTLSGYGNQVRVGAASAITYSALLKIASNVDTGKLVENRRYCRHNLSLRHYP